MPASSPFNLHPASEKARADVMLGARLHSAMGAAVAWEPAGQHVASVALDGTVVVMVRSCAEPCVQCGDAGLPAPVLGGETGLALACAHAWSYPSRAGACSWHATQKEVVSRSQRRRWDGRCPKGSSHVEGA